MRSVRSLSVALAVISLAGCSTTQQEAARLQLNSARLRATEHAVRIRQRNPNVRVEQVAAVRGTGGSAIVVRLRNLSSQPLTDLPISVGVTARRHRPIYLNGGAGLDYFSTHTPALAAGGELTWVLRTDRRLPVDTHALSPRSGGSLRHRWRHPARGFPTSRSA